MAINPDGSPTYFPLPQQAFNEALSIAEQAEAAWSMMILEFGAENLAMGITQTQQTAVGNALMKVISYGSQGALILAFNELSNVVIPPNVSPFLTSDRIQWMKNKLIDVLSQLK